MWYDKCKRRDSAMCCDKFLNGKSASLLWVDIFSKDANVEGEGGTMWVLGNEYPRNKAKPELAPPGGCNYSV